MNDNYLNVESEKAYDEVTRFLGESSISINFQGNSTSYYLSKISGDAVVTTAKSRKIKFGKKVSEDIKGLVKHIIDSEKRGNDLE